MTRIDGLTWKSDSFKYLGINFSLDKRKLYDLNFPKKIQAIETQLNIWSSRNLSLSGKVCVII